MPAAVPWAARGAHALLRAAAPMPLAGEERSLPGSYRPAEGRAAGGAAGCSECYTNSTFLYDDGSAHRWGRGRRGREGMGMGWDRGRGRKREREREGEGKWEGNGKMKGKRKEKGKGRERERRAEGIRGRGKEGVEKGKGEGKEKGKGKRRGHRRDTSGLRQALSPL